MIIIIGWSPTDFHIADILFKGNKFNVHHYMSAILQSFSDLHIGEVEIIDQ
jgi:hypothetical protein